LELGPHLTLLDIVALTVGLPRDIGSHLHMINIQLGGIIDFFPSWDSEQGTRTNTIEVQGNDHLGMVLGGLNSDGVALWDPLFRWQMLQSNFIHIT
jgi:hypothetical protein